MTVPKSYRRFFWPLPETIAPLINVEISTNATCIEYNRIYAYLVYISCFYDSCKLGYNDSNRRTNTVTAIVCGNSALQARAYESDIRASRVQTETPSHSVTPKVNYE